MEKEYKPLPDVEALRYHGTPEKPDIKIFVSHRIDQDSETIDNPLYIPVRCGAVYDERENVEMLGDDTGENISEKRNSYCELTVQYWAWKNIEADYYGLCHYRRYLSFSSKHFSESIQNLAIFDSMSTESLRTCGLLDEEKIRKQIGKFDIIVSQAFDVGNTVTPGGLKFKTVNDYWYKGWGEFLIKKENLDLLFDVILKKYPSLKSDIKELLRQPYFRGYNCFVMRKEAFNELCEFEFDIISQIEPMLDLSGASSYRNRTLGYFGEILYTLWIYRAKKYKTYSINERQLLLFQDTSKAETLYPLYPNSVPIVFSATVHDMHMLHPVVQSIVEHVSDRRQYEIIIIVAHNSDFTKREKREKALLSTLVESYDNITIRFLDPKEQLKECDLRDHAGKQCAEQGVYRLLLPWILEHYSKVIVLNGCSIVEKDLAILFDCSLSTKCIGAVRDIYYNGAFYSNSSIREHANKYLTGINPSAYFDTDVLLMDLEKLRKTHKIKDAIDLHWDIGEKISSTDGMNILYTKDVHYLPYEWNYLEWSDESFASITKWADESVEKAYCKVKSPNIRNFKSWDNLIDSIYASEYWKYARKTPVYELILSLLSETKASRIDRFNDLVRCGYFDNRTGARKIADKLMPPNSLRRKIAKFLVPRDSPQWKLLKQIYFLFRPEYRPKKPVVSEEDEE